MRMTLLALPVALLALAAAATPPDIALPPEWEQRFIRYAIVDDTDRGLVRHIHIDPAAHAGLRAGAPAPEGTLLVMADARARRDAAGRPLLDVAGRFVAEPGWIAIYTQAKQAGDWRFAAFDGAGRRRDVSLAPCAACHAQARAAEDHTFTLWDYAATRGP
jgi:hypothetical protein